MCVSDSDYIPNQNIVRLLGDYRMHVYFRLIISLLYVQLIKTHFFLTPYDICICRAIYQGPLLNLKQNKQTLIITKKQSNIDLKLLKNWNCIHVLGRDKLLKTETAYTYWNCIKNICTFPVKRTPSMLLPLPRATASVELVGSCSISSVAAAAEHHAAVLEKQRTGNNLRPPCKTLRGFSESKIHRDEQYIGMQCYSVGKMHFVHRDAVLFCWNEQYGQPSLANIQKINYSSTQTLQVQKLEHMQ